MSGDNSNAMSYQKIVNAGNRIAGYIHKTPIQTCSTIDEKVGRSVFFKCENLQKTGAFKARGALNAVFTLKETNPNVPGVVTHSSGNHGQALAWAAKVAGIPCSVVVPNNAPSVKTAAIQGYGAKLVYCEPNPQSREETCVKIQNETGQIFVPPFDHVDVITGQGTIGLEFLEQVPELDVILVPVSGGGMISGIAIAAKHLRPEIKVFAVEPLGKELEPSLRASERLWPNPSRYVDTIADGIRFQQVGHITFPLMCELLEKEVLTVNDEEITEAMKFSWERMKLVIETASAAGVAAVMSRRMRDLDPAIRNVGVILCGGNVDLDQLPWIKK
jgi:serine racemase